MVRTKYLAHQFGDIVRLKRNKQRFLPEGQHLLMHPINLIRLEQAI